LTGAPPPLTVTRCWVSPTPVWFSFFFCVIHSLTKLANPVAFHGKHRFTDFFVPPLPPPPFQDSPRAPSPPRAHPFPFVFKVFSNQCVAFSFSTKGVSHLCPVFDPTKRIYLQNIFFLFSFPFRQPCLDVPPPPPFLFFGAPTLSVLLFLSRFFLQFFPPR